MNLRVKLHRQPDETDIKKVKEFRTSNESKLSEKQEKSFIELITDLEKFYRPTSAASLKVYINQVASKPDLTKNLKTTLNITLQLLYQFLNFLKWSVILLQKSKK